MMQLLFTNLEKVIRILLITILLSPCCLNAQENFNIKIRLVDEKKELISHYPVQILVANKIIDEVLTDDKGILDLEIPSRLGGKSLNILIRAFGYYEKRLQIVVNKTERLYDLAMEPDLNTNFCEPIGTYKIPLIDNANPGSTTIYSAEQIRANGR